MSNFSFTSQIRNERETAFRMLVPTRGKGMQFGTRRTPNPACALTHQSRRHTSKQICDNVRNCETFAHTSRQVNIDKIPPTATLSNPAYVNAYPAGGFPSGVLFPPVTRFNDFALTISDNQAVQSVSATIQYWNDNSPSEFITPLTLNNDHTTSAFTPGRPSFNALITLKKSGTAIITVTIRDTAGNEIRPVYTIDTEFRPMLHLNTAGFVDFRTQSLVVTPQDFARTSPVSADARYKKVGSTYNLMGTGAAISPNFHYILKPKNSDTPVRDYPAKSGEGVLTFNKNSAATDLSTLPDGEYRLFAIYSDFLKNSSGANVRNVPENPDYASVAIVLIDNTTAPSATNPASPQHLSFSPAVPAPRVVAATGHVSTRDCDATGVAVAQQTIQNPLSHRNQTITFLGCQADVQATGFSTVGKRDIYILSASQQASATGPLPTARQAMALIAVAPATRGTADNMSADGRIIRADVQAGTTDAAKVQAVTTQVLTVAPVKIEEVQTTTVEQQVFETIFGMPLTDVIAPFVANIPSLVLEPTVTKLKNTVLNMPPSDFNQIFGDESQQTPLQKSLNKRNSTGVINTNPVTSVIHAPQKSVGTVPASLTTTSTQNETMGNGSGTTTSADYLLARQAKFDVSFRVKVPDGETKDRLHKV